MAKAVEASCNGRQCEVESTSFLHSACIAGQPGVQCRYLLRTRLGVAGCLCLPADAETRTNPRAERTAPEESECRTTRTRP